MNPKCNKDLFERTPTVILSCNKKRINSDAVKFLDVYSDIQERDVLVFQCPACGANHESLIYL